MTFLELQDLILDWLDDPNAGYFTRSKVKQWLNNGQREVQKLLIKAAENWYMTCTQTTLVANQSDYVLPENFLKVNNLVIVQNPGTSAEEELPVTPLTPVQTTLVSSQAALPRGFYLKKRRLVLVPKPDSAYTLRLYYSYRVPDMLEDAEVPDVPEEYHELVAIIGAENGFIKDGRNPSSLLEKKKKYEDLFRTDAEDRIESAPREVVVTDED